MVKVKLTLNLPVELNIATQRIVEGTKIIVTRDSGFVGDVTEEELIIIENDPYINISGDDSTEKTAKAPTKKELLAQAKADGLEVEVTDKNTIAEITAAIEVARNAKAETESKDDSAEKTEE